MKTANNRPKLVFSYWENGQMLCKGTAREIAESMQIKEKTIYNMWERKNPCIKLEGRLEQVYEIFTTDGAVVFAGTAKECADRLFIARDSFKHVLQDMKTGKRNGKCGAELVRRKGMEVCRHTI